jgi:type VI protein secretion system component Hcp
MSTKRQPRRDRWEFASWIFGLVITLVVATVGTAAATTFMEIPGLPGESRDQDHRDWIVLTAYTQSVGLKPCLKAIVMKNLDRASPGLATFAAANTKIPLVTIHMEKEVDGRGILFFEARLEQVVIDEVAIIDDFQGGSSVTEKVVLLPKRATISYFPESASGLPLPPVLGTLGC